MLGEGNGSDFKLFLKEFLSWRIARRTYGCLTLFEKFNLSEKISVHHEVFGLQTKGANGQPLYKFEETEKVVWKDTITINDPYLFRHLLWRQE